MRAADKRKILVDIGNIPPAEIDTFMNRIIDRMKKIPLVDPATGDYNLRYNMQNITEDFYLPVRGKDSGTDITNLPGLQFNAIEDIEYLRNKLMAAFKVPKSFIGYEEDINGKATLAAQDVRFARTIERIQRIMVSELTKIAIVHLYVQGFTDEDLIDFELSLTNPSVIYEQEKLNLWKEKIGVAKDIADIKMLSHEWIYHNILELSDDEIKEEQKKIQEDVKRMAELEAAAQPPQPGAAPGGPEMGGAPPEGEPTDDAGEPPTEEEEQQIDDVDQILASLEPTEEESELEDVPEEELEEAKMGRPKTGMKFGQDSHPRGRDPLGHKENLGSLTVRKQRNDKRKSPLALTKEIQMMISQVKKPAKKVLMEDKEPTGSLLDESNILDLEN